MTADTFDFGGADGAAPGQPREREVPAHLADLTENQRQAATYAGGPVVVLAGPGTGKTRTIIHRVQHLLLPEEAGGRGARPEQVVMLTFSIKAANEIRARLAKALGGAGSAIADRVNVHTFHSLGSRLVARFPDLAGFAGPHTLIDSAQRRRLLRELILEHDLFPGSAALGADSILAEVESDLEVFWNNNLSAATRRDFVARRRLELSREGLLDPRETAARVLQLDRFEHVSRLAELFEAACRKRGWLAMSELLTLPIRILEGSLFAASTVRNEWRHILVDEFQDVNGAQIDLLRLLAPSGSGWGGAQGPDLCVVGDDDQAIYEFRGADDRAFQKFERAWPGHHTIELTENFRSKPCIVAVTNDIMSRAARESRFRPDKVARSANRPPAPDAPAYEREEPEVIAVQLKDYGEDADVIAAMILEHRAKFPAAPLRRIAVIARTNKDLTRAAAALEIEGIRYAVRERRSVAEDPGVQDVLAWIEFVIDPDATWAARRLLIRPPFGYPPLEIAQLERQYRASRARHESGDPSAVDPGTFASWLRASALSEDSTLAVERRETLERFLSLATDFTGDAARLPAEDAIFRIIIASNAAHADLLPPRERAERVAALVAVLRFARERQSRLDEPGDLEKFWSYYQDLSDKDQGFELIDGRIDGASGTDEDDDTDAVQLLTAHGAKGLEFDTVFVMRVSPPGFPTVKGKDTNLPEGLIDRAGDTRSPIELSRAEERRLFYVACTRAERRLVLLAKKNKAPSSTMHFFEELVLGRRNGPPITITDTDAVVFQAAASGAWEHLEASRQTRSVDQSALQREGRGLTRMTAQRDALARVRSEARTALAQALADADRPGAAVSDSDATAYVARDAAARLAIVAAVERSLPAPEWVRTNPRWLELDAALRATTDKKERPALPEIMERVKFKAMKPPLRLSFKDIEAYERCPRCFYLMHELRLSEAPSPAAAFGTAAHEALQRFYELWAEADAAGATLPGPERLVQLGREALYRATKRAKVDRNDVRRLEAQLRLVHAKLHSDDLHVSEREMNILMPYAPSNGPDGGHTISVRIDRVDQLPAGAYPPGAMRIVDYKSGNPGKKYTQPSPKDLQLGLYALALQHEFGEPALKGIAEYWVLSTGERGVIPIEDLRLDDVRHRLDKAIAGMLAGDFRQGKDCGNGKDSNGPCAILGP